MGYGNDEPYTVTSSTRHVTVEYLVTSSSDVSGGLMASYVTLGTTRLLLYLETHVFLETVPDTRLPSDDLSLFLSLLSS